MNKFMQILSNYNSITILRKIVVEENENKRKNLENTFLVSLFLPFLIVSIFATLIIAPIWHLNQSTLLIFISYLCAVVMLIIALPAINLSYKIKNHIINFIVSLSLVFTFFVYYKHIKLDFWLLFIIVLLPTILSLNFNAFYYLSFTGAYIALLIYLSGDLIYYKNLNGHYVFYLAVFLALIICIFMLKYLFNTIIEHQLNQFANIKDQNNYIKDLFEELKDKNKILNDYNDTIENNNKKLEFYANYDSLTKLRNRHQIYEILEELIIINNKEKQQLAFIYVDIDDFKDINDTQGHHVGDMVLIKITEKIKAILPEEFIIGRLGGDEFAVIIPDYKDDFNIKKYTNRIIEALKNDIVIEKRIFSLSASFGVAIYPEDASNINSLISAADTAMYHSKANKKINLTFFEQKMRNDIIKRLQKESLIDKALEKNEFYIEYQPFIDKQNDEVVGYEALIRWNSPEIGKVSPLDFISIAENTGKIADITNFLVNQVCHDLPQFHKIHGEQLFVSINISPVQFNDDKIVHDILSIINKHETNPENIVLEITESAFIKNPDFALKLLNQFKKCGIKIAIDDFGTGYASLEHLLNLSFDILKIDKAFIDIIESENKHTKCEVIDAIVNLARGLEMQVIAEGVETKKQVDYLKKSDCDLLQGYYYSKPLPRHEFNSIIINNKIGGIENENNI